MITEKRNQLQAIKITDYAYPKSELHSVVMHTVKPKSHCQKDQKLVFKTDPGVPSLIQVGSHNFVEIDHEIISRVILLPSTDSFQIGLLSVQEMSFKDLSSGSPLVQKSGTICAILVGGIMRNNSVNFFEFGPLVQVKDVV